MSHGTDVDALAGRLKWEASTAMPLSKQREFNAFLDNLLPLQRSLRFGEPTPNQAPPAQAAARGRVG